MGYSQGGLSKQGLYYQKDKKAMIYSVTSVPDIYGNSKKSYRPIAAADLWCYARQLSQEQKFAAAQYGAKEERIFVFNYHDGVEVYDLVKYRGEWFEITRVDLPEDYKGGEMFVYVKPARAPKDSEILPYDV